MTQPPMTAGRSGTAGGHPTGDEVGLTVSPTGSSVGIDGGSDQWGRLVRAEFGTLLRHPVRRPETPDWRLAAGARPRRFALVALVLLAGGGHIDAALAAPRATPDPHPAAGSTGTPAPDSYREAPTSTPSTPAGRPATQPVTRPATSGSPSSGTVTKTQAPTRAVSPKPKKQPTKAAPKPATTRTAAPARQQSVRAAAVATSADGGRLLLGGLALAALALASGSLLLLMSRAGALETRS